MARQWEQGSGNVCGPSCGASSSESDSDTAVDADLSLSPDAPADCEPSDVFDWARIACRVNELSDIEAWWWMFRKVGVEDGGGGGPEGWGGGRWGGLSGFLGVLIDRFIMISTFSAPLTSSPSFNALTTVYSPYLSTLYPFFSSS